MLVSSEVTNVLRSRLLIPTSRERPSQRAFELTLIVDFEQGVHAKRLRGLFEIRRNSVIHRGENDQDGIGTPDARLNHLINVKHEILAQYWQPGRSCVLAPGGPAVPRNEGASVSTDRPAAPPASISRATAAGSKSCPDQSFRGACLLELGDERRNGRHLCWRSIARDKSSVERRLIWLRASKYACERMRFAAAISSRLYSSILRKMSLM